MRCLPLVVLILAAAASATDVCPTCENLTNAPEAGIFLLLSDTDASNQYIDIIAYYENGSIREPVGFSAIIIELTNATGLQVVKKTYTDEDGKARFRFNSWNHTCLNIKALYCPYCVPEDAECEGFTQCLDLANIQSSATSAADIETAADAALPLTLNTAVYMPSVSTATWCPPPAPASATPAICFPLILIFSLLAGALYLSGRNPFVGFNIGGMRVGQHIRYQARARGFSFSITQALMAAGSIAEGATYARGKDKTTGKRRGLKGLAKREWASMKMTGIGGFGTKGTWGGRIKTAISAARSASRVGTATRTGRRGSEGGGRGRGGAVTTGTGTAGAGVQQTAGGTVSTPGSGMTGISGSDILGGSSFVDRNMWSRQNAYGFGTLARIAMFVVMNTTLGRALDSVVSSATFDDRAGRGQGIFELMFVNHSQRMNDAAATIQALRGENGGWRVSVGSEEVVVLGERREEGRTIVTIEAPEGSAMEGGRYEVTIGDTGRVTAITFNMAGAVPPTEQNPQGVGQVVIMRPTEERGLEIFVRAPLAEGQEPTLQRLEGAASQAALNAYGANVPIAFSLSSSEPTAFIDSYREHMAGIAELQQTVRTEGYLDMGRRESETASQIGQNPEAREAVRQVRYDVAAEAVGTTLGISEDELRTGGRSELFDGMDRESSSVTPGRSMTGVESAASHVFEANLGAGEGGVTAFASDAGVGRLLEGAEYRNDASAGAVREHVPAILGNLSVSEMASMTPERMSVVLAEGLQARGMDASQASSVAQDISARMAPNLGQMRDAATSFQSHLRDAGFNAQMMERVTGVDVTSIGVLSEAGRMMQDSNVTALLASRPDSFDRYNMPDAVAQPVREWAHLQQVVEHPSLVDDVNRGRPGEAPVYAAQELPRPEDPPRALRPEEHFGDMMFDSTQAGMVNTARGVSGAFSDDVDRSTGLTEYGQAVRGLDAGLFYENLTNRTGFGERSTAEAAARSMDLPPEAAGMLAGHPHTLEGAEMGRRTAIETAVRTGDFSEAREITGAAVRDYRMAERAAREAGDQQAADRFHQAGDAYSSAFREIDIAQDAYRNRPPSATPPTPPPPPPPEGVPSPFPEAAPSPQPVPQPESPWGAGTVRAAIDHAGDASELAHSVEDVRSTLSLRRHEDLIEVKERIETRLGGTPGTPRPRSGAWSGDEVWAEGRSSPLTPER